MVTSQACDFKGNVLQASRRLRGDVHADADWSALSALTDVSAIATAAEPLLETESFGTQTAYDALNRPTSVTAPDASEVKPTYNEAGLLERVEARVRGAVAWTTFVDDIDYDAKGQRVRKVWEHSGLVEERIYLGGYEVYRRRNGSGLSLERQTLHVMDGARRVAMVETKTVDTSGPFTVPPTRSSLRTHTSADSRRAPTLRTHGCQRPRASSSLEVALQSQVSLKQINFQDAE
ncbi:hypothetical protein WMF37_45610 [Sorangium sp. So ce291]